MNRQAKLTPAMEAHKWKKGQPSPNASGRPRRKPIEEELLHLIDEQASAKDGPTHARRIAEAMLTAAGKGNVKAFMAVADRIDGRVPQPVELSGPESGPMIIDDLAEGRKRVAECRKKHPRPGEETTHSPRARQPL